MPPIPTTCCIERDMLRAVSMPVVAVRTDGHVSYWNAAAESLFRWPRHTDGSTLPPSAVAPQLLAACIDPSSHDTTSTDLEMPDESGQLVPWRVLRTTVRKGCEQSGYLAVFTNLTDLRQTEAALAERMKELRTLHAVSECLQRNDLSLSERFQDVVDRLPGGWRWPDRTAVRLRLKTEEWVTKGFRDTAHMLSVEVAAGLGQLDVALDCGFDFSGGPFLVEEEELLATIAKQIQAAIEVDRVEQRFVRSQRMEAIGQLASGVAHDFNNLLTVVMNQSNLLCEELGDDPLAEEVSLILAAAKRATNLTAQLLALGRKQALQARTIDTMASVHDITKLARRLLPANIELRTSVSNDPLGIRVDPGKLEQALLNLIINARDALPDGGTIDVSVRWNADTDEVVIRVCDDGIGLDSETASRMFEPFFSTKAEQGGTGLGLATTYNFVLQSGGRVDVDSEPGNGACIELAFPRAPKRALNQAK